MIEAVKKRFRPQEVIQPELLMPIDRAMIIKPGTEQRPTGDAAYVTPFGIAVFDDLSSLEGIPSKQDPYIAKNKARFHFERLAALLTFVNTQQRVEETMSYAWNLAVTDIRTHNKDHGFTNNSETTVSVAQVFIEDNQLKVTTLQSGHSMVSALLPDGKLQPLTPNHSVLWDDMGNQEVPSDDEEKIARMNPFDVYQRQDRYNLSVTKRLSSGGIIDPLPTDDFSYTLQTHDLPKGTIALLAQTVGVHGMIHLEHEAMALRGAQSANQAAQQILKAVDFTVEQEKAGIDAHYGYVATPIILPEDASLAILQFAPFLKKPLPLPTGKHIGAITTLTLATTLIGYSYASSGKELPPPPVKTEDTRPTPGAEPTAPEASPTPIAPKETAKLYEAIPLSRYYPGEIKVTIGPKGANVRADASSNPTRVENWVMSPARITKINGVPIDSLQGENTFIITRPPVTFDRDEPTNRLKEWIVVEVEGDFGRSGQSNIQKRDAYISLSKATQGVVDPLNEQGNPLQDRTNLSIRKLDTRNGDYVDEDGEKVSLGQIQIVSP